MAAVITCQHCATQYPFDPALVGQHVHCANCNGTFLVSQQAVPAAPEQPGWGNSPAPTTQPDATSPQTGWGNPQPADQPPAQSGWGAPPADQAPVPAAWGNQPQATQPQGTQPQPTQQQPTQPQQAPVQQSGWGQQNVPQQNMDQGGYPVAEEGLLADVPEEFGEVKKWDKQQYMAAHNQKAAVKNRRKADKQARRSKPVSAPKAAKHSGGGGGGAAQMALGAVICIVGIAVTVGSYDAAAPGESYVLFYGPIIGGGIMFFKGAANL